MRVVVACEFSGVVRDAFIAAGHDAVSIDLLPSERSGPHIQRELFGWLAEQGTSTLQQIGLFIFHWPCTRLANSGVRWLYGGKGAIRDEKRWAAMERDAESFRALLTMPAMRIAGENPISHSHARTIMGEHTQIIQPWQFGHGEIKATCLWLKNLPKLVPTNIVEGREAKVHRMPPSPDRWKDRSRTLPGIAAAMADQWGSL